MKLIICGGRDFADHELFHTAITAWIEAHGWPSEVVSGGASGADLMAKNWAHENRIPHREFRANWGLHGKRAGPLRNYQMAEYAAVGGGCLALPGGRGTANMADQARAAGLVVLEVDSAHRSGVTEDQWTR